MKNINKLLLLILVVATLVPILNSCKKGAEDPAFSFYTRKHRLCQTWTITSYTKSEQVNDSVTTYSFDGSTYLKYSAGHYIYRSPGTMTVSFATDGTYEWKLEVSTDTSSYYYDEQGLWYFTGGGSKSETKYKELVALQKTTTTETFRNRNNINTINYTGSGDLETSVFKIVQLTSEGMKFTADYQITNTNTFGDRLIKVKTEMLFKKKG